MSWLVWTSDEGLRNTGRAMSENVDAVHSVHRGFDRGEFTYAEWAHPEVECVNVDGPSPDSGSSLAGMARVWRDFLSAAYDGFSVTDPGLAA
jgi:hypothetical protein